MKELLTLLLCRLLRLRRAADKSDHVSWMPVL